LFIRQRSKKYTVIPDKNFGIKPAFATNVSYLTT